MKLTNVSDSQRISLVRAYVRQLKQICRADYNGDWDSMPNRENLKIDWEQVYASSKVRGITRKSGTIAKIVSRASDEIVEKACELEDN